MRIATPSLSSTSSINVMMEPSDEVLNGMIAAYRAKRQPEGLQINVGPDGLKIKTK